MTKKIRNAFIKQWIKMHPDPNDNPTNHDYREFKNKWKRKTK